VTVHQISDDTPFPAGLFQQRDKTFLEIITVNEFLILGDFPIWLSAF
jgi:hypothetical protein